MVKVSKKPEFLKKLDQWQGLFSPNTDIFIVFEWGRILESEIDKQELKFNVKLRPNCFSVNVSILAVVFCRQILKD